MSHVEEYKVPPPSGETMKAVRFHGKEDIRIDIIPVPQINPGQVKVKPIWCGICGSDLHEFLGGPGLCPTTPHPITGETVPLTFGHEFSGIVEDVADDVTEFKKGDRVCVQPIIYDGTCGACVAGYINCCYSNGFVGLSGWGGGLSEHVVLPKSCCYKLPDNVSLEVGALIEPLAVGWHAVELSPYKDNDSALVLGGGPIGLAVIQALKAKGCKNVIVSEVSSRRKDFAKQFGADHVLDPTKEDIVQRCRDLTDGWGVHVAYDCAGVQAAFKQGVLAVRARGTIVNIAIWEKDATITPNDFCFKERSYMGIATYEGGDFQLVLNAISEGRMNPEAMITKKIAFDEVVDGGFMELIRNKDNTVKILVQVNKLE